MKPIVDWLLWIAFAAVLIVTYPLIFNKRNDDDL
jgi:hypothetical protein